MNGRKVRFGVLIAAAVVLPSTGYLLGFTKAQVVGGEDWSAELEVNHNLLSPSLAGVFALHHGDELKLTDGEKAAILKLVREDAPDLLKAQRQLWDEDLMIARSLLSGEEIVTNYNTVASLRKAENQPYLKAENAHLGRVEQIIDKTRWPILFKIRDKTLQELRSAQYFLLLNQIEGGKLRLSERQKKQFIRLASYQTMITKIKGSTGYDGDYPTLPLKESLAHLQKANPGQTMFFSYAAEDFLDPVQQLQLRALLRDQKYVPVP